MATTKRKPRVTEEDQMRRELRERQAWIIELERTVEKLREEILVVSATAGLAVVSLGDVQRHFRSNPNLRHSLSVLVDLDKLTSCVNQRAAGCFGAIKELHESIRRALPGAFKMR